MSHHLMFGGSYRSLVYNANDVVNRTPDASIKIPSTKYKLQKFMKSIFSSEIHIKCKICNNYVASLKSSTQCDLCHAPVKTIDSDYFHYIPIRQQIKHMVEINFEDVLAYYSAVLKQDQITDIHNADAFKNAQKMFPNHIILPLIVNTDGVKVYRSCSKSLWLIQLYQGYIPPNKRFLLKNILIVAAHMGKTISMSDFFYPLLKEMRKIADDGGITIYSNEQSYDFMPLILGACCDLPATEHLRGTAGFAGHFACGHCFHPGIPIKKDEKSRPYVRYVKGSYENRSHGSYIEAYNKLKSNSSPVRGIKHVSSMIAAYGFDLARGFAVEHMHCGEGGIMNKLLGLWLDTKNHKEPYYISKKNQVILSNRIISLKPVSEISRTPRSIFSRGEYKANELRNMMLFYLRFALPGLLPKKYIDNFQLFSSAMYLLMKDKISREDVNQAQMKLTKFREQYEDLYGKNMVTMNLHLIGHSPETVMHLGPLWTVSAYAAESNNGLVVRSNTSTKDMTFQLVNKYVMRHTVDAHETGEKMHEASLGKKKILNLNTTEIKMLEESGFVVENLNFLTIYTDFSLRGVQFKSLQSKETSRIDYFVELKNGMLATVHYFVIFDSILYAVVEKYDVIDRYDHLIEVSRANTREIVQVNEISKKMMFLKYGLRQFVTTLPNKYEKS